MPTIDSIERRLAEIANEDEEDPEIVLLTTDYSLLELYAPPELREVMSGDMPYSPSVEAILEATCERLGLDCSSLSKEIQQTWNREGLQTYQVYQLEAALEARHLGPRGQALQVWLSTGEPNEEMEQLLRKVCSKILLKVPVEGLGYADSPSGRTLSADLILLEMSKLIPKEQLFQARVRFDNGQSLPGDYEIVCHDWDPADLLALRGRLDGTRPYNPQPVPTRLPWETAADEEAI